MGERFTGKPPDTGFPGDRYALLKEHLRIDRLRDYYRRAMRVGGPGRDEVLAATAGSVDVEDPATRCRPCSKVARFYENLFLNTAQTADFPRYHPDDFFHPEKPRRLHELTHEILDGTRGAAALYLDDAAANIVYRHIAACPSCAGEAEGWLRRVRRGIGLSDSEDRR